MRYRLPIACALVLTALGAWESAGQTASDKSPGDAIGVPRLELSSQEWDFGEVWQGEPLAFEVRIKNTGDAPLTLEVKTSCGCTTPTRPKSPLDPGESDVMKIEYSSKTRVGKANQTVTLNTNDPSQLSAPIKVLGNVKPLYTFEPSGAVFGRVFESTRDEKIVDIVNKYTEPILLQLVEGQDFGQLLVDLEVVTLGQHYRLRAKTQPPMKVGLFQAEVKLATGLEKVPELKTRLHISVQPPIAVQPPRLLLPKNSVSPIERTLKITSAPDQRIEIKRVVASLDVIQVEIKETTPATPGAAREYEIKVIWPPGDQIPDGVNPTIQIFTSSDNPDYAVIEVQINVISPRARPGPGVPAPATRPSKSE